MIDIAQLFGQPAVSLADAERTGTVKGLQFDGNRIASIDIGDGRTVPAEAVTTFEGEALTYQHEAVELSTSGTEGDATHEQEDGDDTTDSGDAQAAADPGVLADELPLPVAAAVLPWWGDPTGTLLLSDAGDSLGTLTGMHIDAEGVVVEVDNDRGDTYAGDRVLTVGSFATIITAADDDSA